jgi:ribA/ribD-fused uncharacterized protein
MIYDQNGGRHPTITAEGIYGFFDEFRFLSNFHVCNVTREGIVFPSSEHAYMAAKTEDFEIKQAIVTDCPTPSKAKKFGRLITLRSDWDFYRVAAMLDVVTLKFQQNPELAAMLLATDGMYLEETNDWGDTFWGVDIKKGGLNMLGKCLMIVRDNAKGWIV